jgi:hypothetical protein
MTVRAKLGIRPGYPQIASRSKTVQTEDTTEFNQPFHDTQSKRVLITVNTFVLLRLSDHQIFPAERHPGLTPANDSAGCFVNFNRNPDPAIVNVYPKFIADIQAASSTSPRSASGISSPCFSHQSKIVSRCFWVMRDQSWEYRVRSYIPQEAEEPLMSDF